MNSSRSQCSLDESYTFHIFQFLITKVQAEKLKTVLTNRSTFARGEVIVSPIRADQAVDVRDAFAKGVYGRIFVWIVGKINQAVYKPTVGFLLIQWTFSISIYFLSGTKILVPWIFVGALT